MKYAVGTRVKVINHGEMPEFNGHKGYVFTVGQGAYGVRLDGDDLNTPCYENEVEMEEFKFKSPMENYGRALLPLLHGSMDAPKMVYYSSTRRAVYMMDKMMDTSDYFTVCVTRMLWNSEIQDYDANKLASEVFRLKQPRDMSKTLEVFSKFMQAHINYIPKDYADLLWQEDK